MQLLPKLNVPVCRPMPNIANFAGGKNRKDMHKFSKLLLMSLPLLMLSHAMTAENRGKENCKTAIVAHRGYWNCEEAGYAKNSLAALKCAQEAGFWGSEFDVNMTSDEVLLVYHDSEIDGKRIESTLYAEFKDVRLANGEPVPTVDDYLAQVRRRPGTVMVYELKTHSTPEIENRLVDLTVEKLKEYGLDSPDKVIFISFSINICKRMAELMPGYTVQYLSDDYSPDQLAEMGITGVDYHYNVFSSHPGWYDSARARSMSVNVWTVDSEEDMVRMKDLGVDMLTTDCPDLARRLFGVTERKAGDR